jgi:hypothetical protein
VPTYNTQISICISKHIWIIIFYIYIAIQHSNSLLEHKALTTSLLSGFWLEQQRYVHSAVYHCSLPGSSMLHAQPFQSVLCRLNFTAASKSRMQASSLIILSKIKRQRFRRRLMKSVLGLSVCLSLISLWCLRWLKHWRFTFSHFSVHVRFWLDKLNFASCTVGAVLKRKSQKSIEQCLQLPSDFACHAVKVHSKLSSQHDT